MKNKYRVWVWGNEGQKTLFKGSKKECSKFRKNYRGYRKTDMYITECD